METHSAASTDYYLAVEMVIQMAEMWAASTDYYLAVSMVIQ